MTDTEPILAGDAPPLSNRTPDWYSTWGKRWLDLAVGGLLAMVLIPIMGVAAVAVAYRLGRPVLFRQPRPGKNGHPFQMVKFRSMTDARGADGELLHDEQRITRLGRFLRASSIDEFPELWNVMRGDMSLVGPRPLLMQYLHRYSPEQFRRHVVRPGITGWAQVNGRNAISWDQKFAFDLWYVDHYSLWVDLKILCMTGLKLVVPSGISAEGHATMPEFQGNNEDG